MSIAGYYDQSSLYRALALGEKRISREQIDRCANLTFRRLRAMPQKRGAKKIRVTRKKARELAIEFLARML